MGRIDKELALRMMLDGNADKSIAEHFGTSRQAVNLLRKSFAREGKLEMRPRVQKPLRQESSLQLETSAPSPSIEGVPQMAADNSPAEPTYEQITRWVVRVVSEAAEVPKLRQELIETQAHLGDLRGQIELLRGQLEHARKEHASVLAKAAEYQQAIERLRTARSVSGSSPQDAPT
jgi:hypothetical protein